jgi:hypothetical protein
MGDGPVTCDFFAPHYIARYALLALQHRARGNAVLGPKWQVLENTRVSSNSDCLSRPCLSLGTIGPTYLE